MTWVITDTNKKVIAEKCAPGDNLADNVKLRTWKDHCQRVLNIEFPWGKNSINNTVAVDGPAIFVTEVLVTDAITKKQEKAGGPSGVRVENILARERAIVTAITDFVKQIIHEENISEDWKGSFLINCYKGKSNVADGGNWGGLKLLDHLIKVLEHALSQADINHMQFGFLFGRSTTVAIYILRQMQ